MKIFFSCRRNLNVIGAKHELEALRDALNAMLGDDEQVEIRFCANRSQRSPLVVTLYEDRFTGSNPTKKIEVP